MYKLIHQVMPTIKKIKINNLRLSGNSYTVTLKLGKSTPIKILTAVYGVTKEATPKEVTNFTQCYLDLCML